MRGTVFQPEDDGVKLHPYIVISDELDGFVLLVNLTDAGNNLDCPCFIKKGEHPAVTKDSVVAYERAVPLSVAGLRRMLATNAKVFPTPCPAALLQRIIKGAYHEDSRMTIGYRIYLE